MKTHALKRAGKNKWIMAAAIVLIILLGGAGFYYYATWHANTVDESIVETSTIGTGDIILSATGLGTLVASQDVSFGFKNGGQVTEVLVGLGEGVDAGQVLARLESTTLELEYKQAEANLAALSSPAEIAAAKQAVAEAKESFATARDDLQYLIGPDMLVAEERVAAAEQNLQAAKAAMEQDASAENKRIISEAESNLTKAREALEYAYYNYSYTYTVETFTYPVRNDKGLTIRKELIAPTDAELSAARAAYALAAANLYDAQNYLDALTGVKGMEDVPASSITAITAAKLALDSAKANLDATELIAPISGTITSISLNAGEDVGTSAVISISNLDQPYIMDVSLDETDWDKAVIGFAASVTFDLLPDENYSGKIMEVYPVLDDSSGLAMVHILVRLDESTGVDLPAGSTASVDIVGGEALDAVLVPTSALKEVEAGQYIVYLMKNAQPVVQDVEIGLQGLLYAEVKSGLKAGDVVLTDAQQATVTP